MDLRKVHPRDLNSDRLWAVLFCLTACVQVQVHIFIPSPRTETPYGPVLQHMDLVVDDKPFAWPFIHPFAMLYYACSCCEAFALMLKRSLSGRPGSVVIYADECTPGNVLRPDDGASFRVPGGLKPMLSPYTTSVSMRIAVLVKSK